MRHLRTFFRHNSYVSSIDALKTKVSSLRQQATTQQDIINMVKECQNFQVKVYDYEKFWENPVNKEINQQIEEILQDDKTKFDKDLLKELFKLKLPTLTNISIINSFYTRNPKAYIDKPLALIPFRQSIFNGDLQNSLKLTDITVGHQNYIKHKHQELKSGVIRLVGSSIGLTLFSKYGVQELIDNQIVDDSWRYLGSINSLILTYLINSTFLMTIVRFGRQLISSGGDYLTWQKGTFYSHWYKHADEMLLCTKIVEADIQLNGGGISGGEVSPELKEELCRTTDNEISMTPGYNRRGQKIRLLDLKDNFEDLKLQAYWMSGGDGFEWVEPDQDPAILIWKKHLKEFDLLASDNKKSLKWAENLIEEK